MTVLALSCSFLPLILIDGIEEKVEEEPALPSKRSTPTPPPPPVEESEEPGKPKRRHRMVKKKVQSREDGYLGRSPLVLL